MQMQGTDNNPLLVFDVGMFDGGDTRYYLDLGFNVVAVEANPELCAKASKLFASELEEGRLTLINRAIAERSGEEKNLYLFAEDLAGSSTVPDGNPDRKPVASYAVKSVTISDLLEKYGTPYFLKSDVPYADHLCILPIENDNRPEFVSFPAGNDAESLVRHLQKLGYTGFKAINQCNYFEMHNQNNLRQRFKFRIIDMLGYRDPSHIRMNGRFFLRGNSAGLVPWQSDGEWQQAESLLTDWNAMVEADALEGCWYDFQATLGSVQK